MTPDLKRLCEAAENLLSHHVFVSEAVREATVRAVLMELREVSEGMAKIAEGYVTSGAAGDYMSLGFEVQDGFTAMIDHILAEPNHPIVGKSGQTGR